MRTTVHPWVGPPRDAAQALAHCLDCPAVLPIEAFPRTAGGLRRSLRCRKCLIRHLAQRGSRQ